jgi:hypothetical protein
MTKRMPPMSWEAPSDRFLAYLDRLAAAALSRDKGELDKLMRMRMSSHLSPAVLDEMEFFRRSKDASLRAPLKLMRFVHQMRQLASRPEVERPQLGLGLKEREVSLPDTSTRRRPPRVSEPSGPGRRRDSESE